MKKYDVILADSPWDFEVWNRDTGNGRSASAHYNTMSLDEICNLPVRNLAADNCALFLWVVWPRLFDAQAVIKSWGFEYKTLAFEWWKLNKSWSRAWVPMLDVIQGYEWLERLFFFGMGYYTRANSEPCLLAVKGNMPVSVRNERNFIIAPIRRHSQKPDEQYGKIERLYPNRNYLELFARSRYSEDWDVFGNEVENSISLEPDYD